MTERAAIEREVAAYYADRLRAHGPVAQGVDWNGPDSQRRRFEVLADLWRGDPAASLLDLGCGYGALLEHARADDFTGDYLGLDLAPTMIQAAQARHGFDRSASFAVGARSEVPSDYAVASGLFNVRLSTPADRWEAYIGSVLDDLHGASRKGFAFNCLSSYSDPERMQARLYYGDPRDWFDRCVRRYSRWVALRQDYGLYEFTLIVRKSG